MGPLLGISSACTIQTRGSLLLALLCLDLPRQKSDCQQAPALLSKTVLKRRPKWTLHDLAIMAGLVKYGSLSPNIWFMQGDDTLLAKNSKLLLPPFDKRPSWLQDDPQQLVGPKPRWPSQDLPRQHEGSISVPCTVWPLGEGRTILPRFCAETPPWPFGGRTWQVMIGDAFRALIASHSKAYCKQKLSFDWPKIRE